VKAEDPGACVTVNCNLLKSTAALYLNVVKGICNQVPHYTWQYERAIGPFFSNEDISTSKIMLLRSEQKQQFNSSTGHRP
jgi:hypothetical protein